MSHTYLIYVIKDGVVVNRNATLRDIIYAKISGENVKIVSSEKYRDILKSQCYQCDQEILRLKKEIKQAEKEKEALNGQAMTINEIKGMIDQISLLLKEDYCAKNASSLIAEWEKVQSSEPSENLRAHASAIAADAAILLRKARQQKMETLERKKKLQSRVDVLLEEAEQLENRTPDVQHTHDILNRIVQQASSILDTADKKGFETAETSMSECEEAIKALPELEKSLKSRIALAHSLLTRLNESGWLLQEKETVKKYLYSVDPLNLALRRKEGDMVLIQIDIDKNITINHLKGVIERRDALHALVLDTVRKSGMKDAMGECSDKKQTHAKKEPVEQTHENKHPAESQRRTTSVISGKTPQKSK